MLRIAVNYENNAEDWWEAARAALAADTLPERVLPVRALLDDSGTDDIVVNTKEAHAILRWAASLPGWEADDSPEYAPNPLVSFVL